MQFVRRSLPSPLAEQLGSQGSKLEFYTVTLDFGDQQITHRSMAPNWTRALSLALQNVSSFPLTAPTIKIERK